MRKRLIKIMTIMMVTVMSCFSITVEAKKELGDYGTEVQTGDELLYEEDSSGNNFSDEATVVDDSIVYNTGGRYGSRPATYLFAVEDGYERVVWTDNYQVVVEKYSPDFVLKESVYIDKKNTTPIGCPEDNVYYGGAHKGENYNFILTGQYNENESDDLNTLRVIKFTKDWEYIDDCQISNNMDVEIYVPFRSGNMEFEELDGNLWISFARTGYDGGDGLHHHGKQNIIIKESDMTLLGSTADFWHSFDQYLEVCNGKMYQMELSEGSRAVFVEDQNIENYTGGWNYNWAAGCDKKTTVFEFWSTDEYGVWSYALYGHTGGFEASDANSRLISVGYSMDQDVLMTEGKDAAQKLNYNVWIASTSTDLSETNFRWLTNYDNSGTVEAELPHIVKVNDDKFLVIWTEYDSENWSASSDAIRYVFVDSTGTPISDVMKMDGYLTDNKPIVNKKGEIVWDAANGVNMYFYKIFPDGKFQVIDTDYADSGSAEGIAVSYKTHVQSYGDQAYVSNGKMSGTSGESKRLEAIYINVSGNENLGIQYTTHCQSYGWLPWSANGEMNGTEGEAKRLEAIKIQLTGADKDKYDVCYRVHAQSYGWLGWAKNGAPAGTAGYGKRLEGIQVIVVKKGDSFNQSIGNITSARTESFVAKEGSSPIVNYAPTSNTNPVVPGAEDVNVAYRTHVQSFGWQAWKYNGQMSGTSGQAKRLEGINIELRNKDCSGDIVYTTHVQSYGWQGSETDQSKWYKNGQMAGTSGEAKRLEAICINLTGEMAQNYDIYYRVHAQSYGWLGWAKNGAPAGTAGYAKRLEGIQIVLVPKGGAVPGDYQGVVSIRTEAYIKK